MFSHVPAIVLPEIQPDVVVLCACLQTLCGLVHFVSDGLKYSCGHEPFVTSRSERQLQHNADSVRESSLCKGEYASIFLSLFFLAGGG